MATNVSPLEMRNILDRSNRKHVDLQRIRRTLEQANANMASDTTEEEEMYHINELNARLIDVANRMVDLSDKHVNEIAHP